MLSEGIHKVGNTYEMPLPFKENNSKQPNNKSLATKRLNQLKVRLQRDGNYRNDYNDFMNEVIRKGFAEEVPDAELHATKAYYIPHHGVYNPNKQQKKIRVVFDCSAKFAGSS